MFYAQGINRRKRWYRMLTIGQKKLFLLFGFLLAAIAVALGVLLVYTERANRYDLKRVLSCNGSSMLFDSNNQPIAALGCDEGNYATWGQLPENLIKAFVAREDERFFSHDGIVWSSVLRSLLRNVESGRFEQGASTITMQLVRNVYELQGKTIDRKLLEAMLAQRVEGAYGKETIFTQYLNRIYFGCSCYGIADAARYYFGKPVSKLNLVECATLAGIVRGPSIFNPVHSMDSAMEVKKETLTRMLEMESISREEYDAAVRAPIVLSHGTTAGMAAQASTYPTMWAQKELESLQPYLKDSNGRFSAVSSLDLGLQQYVEEAAEQAMQAVERRKYFPEPWLSQLHGDSEEKGRLAKVFTEAARPARLKSRGESNLLENVLQCCVLVVDNRNGKRGNILAVLSGRSAADGIDRWRATFQPGRVAAPLLFCVACMPGGDDCHIVARSAEVTGMRLGYEAVRSFYDSLGLGITFPPREKAADLYNGLFDMSRLDAARLLFDLQNKGRGYKLSLIKTIWNSNNLPLYVYEPEKASEYIRRESATSVARLSPFICKEGRPVILNETLPDGGGQWTMVCHDRSVCVFVWMGLDDPQTAAAQSKELPPLLNRAALYMARDIYDKARLMIKSTTQQQ